MSDGVRMLAPCRPSELPLVRCIQRKRQVNPDESGAKACENEFVDDRLYVMASVKDVWTTFNEGPRKTSLCIIQDAGAVAGESIELFYCFSSVLNLGAMLPHQVRPPLCSVC